MLKWSNKKRSEAGETGQQEEIVVGINANSVFFFSRKKRILIFFINLSFFHDRDKYQYWIQENRSDFAQAAFENSFYIIKHK